MMKKFKKKIKSFKFKPFSKKQKKLLYWWEDYSKYKDYDIVIADGAIRSGKTIAMICSFLRWSQANHDGEDFIIAGKSIGALKRNVIKPMQQILDAWGWEYEYVRSQNPYIAIGSNTYYLFGASNEASQDTLQGLTAAGALADEVALFPKNFVDQMIGRCSVDGAKTFMNCNPRGPYHFIKTEYIDKAKEKKIYYLQFNMDDNLSLATRVKERFKRMFEGVFFQRYILGLWVVAEGIIYGNFNKDSMVVDKLPNMKKTWVGIDYGQANATTFILCGLGEDDKFYIIDEYYHSGKETGKTKSPKRYSEEFKEWLEKQEYKPKNVYIDPSAKGFILQLWEEGIRNINQADNDVLRGIELISSLIENDLFRVNKSCKHVLKELSSYTWDSKAQEHGEDKPIKDHDHTLDSIRYVANGIRLILQKLLV